MTANNTPKIAEVLNKHNLIGIPEAHCYFEFKQNTFDITFPENKNAKMIYKLVDKITITPDQIGDYKINWHRNIMKKWLKEINSPYTLDEAWKIREACISKLST